MMMMVMGWDEEEKRKELGIGGQIAEDMYPLFIY